jgi:hypothetical protein
MQCNVSPYVPSSILFQVVFVRYYDSVSSAIVHQAQIRLRALTISSSTHPSMMHCRISLDYTIFAVFEDLFVLLDDCSIFAVGSKENVRNRDGVCVFLFQTTERELVESWQCFELIK